MGLSRSTLAGRKRIMEEEVANCKDADLAEVGGGDSSIESREETFIADNSDRGIRERLVLDVTPYLWTQWARKIRKSECALKWPKQLMLN